MLVDCALNIMNDVSTSVVFIPPPFRMHDVSSYDVFVYGTLRRGDGRHRGAYHHLYLRYSECLRRRYRLPGYALYDYAGLYPFMIPEADRSVLGEMYRINVATKIALDEFEDVSEGLYQFIYLPEHRFYTYVKADRQVANMPRVPDGDWLTYCSGG